MRAGPFADVALLWAPSGCGRRPVVGSAPPELARGRRGAPILCIVLNGPPRGRGLPRAAGPEPGRAALTRRCCNSVRASGRNTEVSSRAWLQQCRC